MSGVPEPEHANRSVGCYGKGQSILVKKSIKTKVGQKIEYNSTEEKSCKEAC